MACRHNPHRNQRPTLHTPPICRAAKLRARQAALLRPANSGGGDADGADYAAALGQKLALGLAAAIEDCDAVFGRGASSGGGGGGSGDEGGGASLRAAFLVWALHQTERWVRAAVV